ncbi:uncharacterized protein BYT42DRAFT_494563 [Radiomyces spectabilis]|uniref:uncharacterized protein n=1 Tax=Radiomyces spectabilis TaxID=64574 RepID=UPI00221F2C5D|nr:uncharacterized protein BYT42DRAFT_494563 [Radiomyces spectabilis]KAI8380995.1 hypothetical protein BYT42DRAFT_494563 [Radiomyces spectabilis]
MLVTQTNTPLLSFYPEWKQWKSVLCKDLIGKRLQDLRTPQLVIDRTILQRNCERLNFLTDKYGIKVRVHIKSHKTIEATELQLQGARTDAIVVSTLAEAYAVMASSLILLGFPISADKFSEVFFLSEKVPAFQIFIALDKYHHSVYGANDTAHRIRVFLKVDCGYHRAGTALEDPKTVELAKRLGSSSYIVLSGLYTHAGHSYNSRSAEEALEYLQKECDMARAFRDLFRKHGVNIDYLSIGATPTVQAIFMQHQHNNKDNVKHILDGISEVHAGAYTLLDRQQVATELCSFDDVAVSVACRVVSVYPDRGSVLIDGGALAFSKDTAPQGGFGAILDKTSGKQWTLTKISQEHGVITDLDTAALQHPLFTCGQLIRVIPNHCCLATACHRFYLVTENGGDTVVDVWVPISGW